MCSNVWPRRRFCFQFLGCHCRRQVWDSHLCIIKEMRERWAEKRGRMARSIQKSKQKSTHQTLYRLMIVGCISTVASSCRSFAEAKSKLNLFPAFRAAFPSFLFQPSFWTSATSARDGRFIMTRQKKKKCLGLA